MQINDTHDSARRALIAIAGFALALAALSGCNRDGKCDIDKLTELKDAATFSKVPPGIRAGMAITGLTITCTRPASVSEMLTGIDKLPVDKIGEYLVRTAKANLRHWERGCPGGKAVLDRLRTLPATQHGDILWEACDVERFGLIAERKHWRASTFGIVTVLYAPILEAAGVPKEVRDYWLLNPLTPHESYW